MIYSNVAVTAGFPITTIRKADALSAKKLVMQSVIF